MRSSSVWGPLLPGREKACAGDCADRTGLLRASAGCSAAPPRAGVRGYIRLSKGTRCSPPRPCGDALCDRWRARASL